MVYCYLVWRDYIIILIDAREEEWEVEEDGSVKEYSQKQMETLAVAIPLR